MPSFSGFDFLRGRQNAMFSSFLCGSDHVPACFVPGGRVLLCLIASWNNDAGAQNRPLERVRLQLKWMHQFQFAGYYAAVEQGYFRDVGLEVELLAATPGIKPSELLSQGTVEYAVMSPVVLIERQQENLWWSWPPFSSTPPPPSWASNSRESAVRRNCGENGSCSPRTAMPKTRRC
jgi:hypothetical protein